MKKAIFLLLIVTICCSNLFAQEPTGDPWIKKAYNNKYGRNPTALEYNINNYNGGKWGDYSDFWKYFLQYQESQRTNGLTTLYSPVVNGKVVVGLFQNGNQIAVSLISNDGGGIVASGGGNVISTGGSGIVASGGGNIVASGGGNISVLRSTKGFGFGANRGVLSVGEVRIPTSGGGAMIIK